MTLQKKKGNIIFKTKSTLLIFYVQKKNEKEVNIQMGNLYNKVRKSSRAVTELPETWAIRYVTYKALIKLHKPPNVQLSYKRAG